MPADVTWALIGYSFIPLALGSGMLFLAFRLAKRWWWRAPACLAGAVLLAYWLVIVFTAAYPTIDQTNSGVIIRQTDSGVRCYAPGGTEEIECPPDVLERHSRQD